MTRREDALLQQLFNEVEQIPLFKAYKGEELAHIEPATPARLREIEAWLRDERDLTFIGGDPGRDPRSQLSEWAGESIAPLAIKVGGRTAAFIAVQPLALQDRTDWELGRLIVDPELRKQKIGASITSFMDYTLHNFLDREKSTDFELVMRVRQENEYAVRMMKNLSLRKVADPRRDIDNLHFWYSSRSRRNANLLGETIEELRRARGLSCKQLADYAHLKESFVRQIEYGRRNPSRENLHALANVLSDTNTQFVQLALAFISEKLPSFIEAAFDIEEARANSRQDLWVVSDLIGELLDSRFLNETVAAIKAGFRRVYFLDNPSKGKDLIQRISERLNPEERARLCVYKAPGSLCALRLALYGAKGFDVSMGTVEGLDKKRAPLSEEAARQVFLALREATLAADNAGDKEVGGFARL